MAAGGKKNNKKHEAHDEHDDHDEGHHGGGHAEHAEEGEPWLVSYADMMTLLFGFFVVMYSFAARDPKVQDCISLKLMEAFKDEKPETDVKGSTMQGAAVRALQMLVTLMNLDSVEDLMEKVQKESENQEFAEEAGGKGEQGKDAKDLKDQLKEKSTADSLKALLGADDSKNLVTIALPADVLFDSGNAVLSRKSVAKIEEIAELLRLYTDIAEIEIAGHTDSQGGKSQGRIDNWTLSVQRAASVAHVFTSAGLPKGVMKVSGRGDSSPLLPEKSSSGQWIPENMRRNRRIEIMIRREKTSVTLNKK